MTQLVGLEQFYINTSSLKSTLKGENCLAAIHCVEKKFSKVRAMAKIRSRVYVLLIN